MPQLGEVLTSTQLIQLAPDSLICVLKVFKCHTKLVVKNVLNADITVFDKENANRK